MPNIRIETDVVATTVAGRDLKVDIFYPGENANGLGIVFLPGGGFRIANKAGLHDRYASRMAEKGYVFIATEYRVMDDAPWPAQIHTLHFCSKNFPGDKMFSRMKHVLLRDNIVSPEKTSCPR